MRTARRLPLPAISLALCAGAAALPAAAEDYCAFLAERAPQVFGAPAGRAHGQPDRRCQIKSADGRLMLFAEGSPNAFAAESVGWYRQKPPAGQVVADEPSLGTAVRAASADGHIVTWRFVAGDRLSSVSLMRAGERLREEDVARARALAAALVAGAPKWPDTCAWLAAHAAEGFGAPAGEAPPPEHGLCVVFSADARARLAASATPMPDPGRAVDGVRRAVPAGDEATPEPALGEALRVRAGGGHRATLHFVCGERYCTAGLARRDALRGADLDRLRALAAGLREAMSHPAK